MCLIDQDDLQIESKIILRSPLLIGTVSIIYVLL